MDVIDNDNATGQAVSVKIERMWAENGHTMCSGTVTSSDGTKLRDFVGVQAGHKIALCPAVQSLAPKTVDRIKNAMDPRPATTDTRRLRYFHAAHYHLCPECWRPINAHKMREDEHVTHSCADTQTEIYGKLLDYVVTQPDRRSA